MSDVSAGPPVAVFGAYGTLGAACARAFAEAGYPLHLVGRKRDELDALAAELGGSPTVAVAEVATSADALDAVSAHPAYAAILAPIGGPAPQGPIAEVAVDDMAEAMQAKLLTQWAVAAAAQAALAPGGTLVLFSGLLARMSVPGMNAMGCVNAAVERLARALDAEADDARTRCLSPGLVIEGEADAANGETTAGAVAALALTLVQGGDGGADGSVVADIPEGAA